MNRVVLRDLTMKMLYQTAFYEGEALKREVEAFVLDEDLRLLPEEQETLLSRFRDVLSKLPEIDRELSLKTEKWSIERIGKVEMAILRLSVYEMENDPEVPEKVAVNEAVELAKKYCGTESSAFINGVLHHFMKESHE